MTTHELARALLDCPDAQVAVHALGHTYHSHYDRFSHGPLEIRIGEDAYGTETVFVGDMIDYKMPDTRQLFAAPREAR